MHDLDNGDRTNFTTVVGNWDVIGWWCVLSDMWAASVSSHPELKFRANRAKSIEMDCKRVEAFSPF
jgi:hypothetical protein